MSVSQAIASLMKITLLIMFCVAFGAVSSAHAYSDTRIRHVAKERQKQAAIDAAAEEIPMLTTSPETGKKYDILGTVQGWDVLNKGKKAVFLQMRRQALTLKADAISDVSCKTVLKAMAQSCEGFAIKWK